MDLAPSVAVITQPVTTTIYHFSVVNVKNMNIKPSKYRILHIKQSMVLFADTVWILRGKRMPLPTTSHLSIFLFRTSLSHIPRVIPPHELSFDFSRSLPVNIQHEPTFIVFPGAL